MSATGCVEGRLGLPQCSVCYRVCGGYTGTAPVYPPLQGVVEGRLGLPQCSVCYRVCGGYTEAV